MMNATGERIALMQAELEETYRSVTQLTNELEREKERFQLLSLYDPLTGLPNRVLAGDRLAHAIGLASRENAALALLYLDLDNFKNVNDTLGHAVGDHLLSEVADRLISCVRESDTVARLGGDEFSIILPRIESSLSAELVARKVLDAFAEPFALDDQAIYATASIGITVYPEDSLEPHSLMRNADAAMYRAKEQGRNNFLFFTPDINERIRERVRMEFQLRHAIERDELFLMYQPIVGAESGKLVGAEALLRWRNPEFGLVRPDQFIGLAEESGLIVPIGDWVLKTACRQARIWRSAVARPFYVAVNVSTRQFQETGLVDSIADTLRLTGLSPESLGLEITESLFIENVADTATALDRIRRIGVPIALDDFGTGYSSLSYLRRFPVNYLKIDGSFVRDITKNGNSAALVAGMVAIAHSLGLGVVAEGVETREQLDCVRERGCEFVQGYYCGKPMSPEEFATLLEI